MLEKISLVLTDESGTKVEVPEDDYGLEIKLDLVITKLYFSITENCAGGGDAETKLAEKFRFAAHLDKFLEEQKKYEQIF